MTIVQMMIGLTRSTLRKAGVILAATQIMLGTAPLTESETRTGAHVEASGVDLHHAHNEESCIACIAFKVFGGAELESPPLPAVAARIAAVPAARDSFGLRLTDGPARSRAPPASILS
jgi:hypothetical protein